MSVKETLPITSYLFLLLRVGEFIFACTVLGIVVHDGLLSNPLAALLPRFHFTLVVSILSMIASLLWVLGTHFLIDFILFLLWIATFGILKGYYDSINPGFAPTCDPFWNWGHFALEHDVCGKWQAAAVFAFLSAMFWLANAAVTGWIGRKRAQEKGLAFRQGWYRFHKVPLKGPEMEPYSTY